MRNTYLSRSALKAALLPFFPAGRAGTALLLLRLSVVAAFLFHGSGKAGELRGALYAQSEPVEESRAAEIVAARQAKAEKVTPEVNGGLERSMLFVKDSKILDRITGGIGGLRLKLGKSAIKSASHDPTIGIARPGKTDLRDPERVQQDSPGRQPWEHLRGLDRALKGRSRLQCPFQG